MAILHVHTEHSPRKGWAKMCDWRSTPFRKTVFDSTYSYYEFLAMLGVPLPLYTKPLKQNNQGCLYRWTINIETVLKNCQEL